MKRLAMVMLLVIGAAANVRGSDAQFDLGNWAPWGALLDESEQSGLALGVELQAGEDVMGYGAHVEVRLAPTFSIFAAASQFDPETGDSAMAYTAGCASRFCDGRLRFGLRTSLTVPQIEDVSLWVIQADLVAAYNIGWGPRLRALANAGLVHHDYRHEVTEYEHVGANALAGLGLSLLGFAGESYAAGYQYIFDDDLPNWRATFGVRYAFPR